MKRSVWAWALMMGVVAAGVAHAQTVEPWATYRGNAQRTGNTDGAPGPDQPKILWVVKSKDHYIASPVPADKRLFLSGLGAFNVATFACISTEPNARQRTLWSKTA